ncbi:Uncharacterized protein GBIM_07062 [Gryllus bimaculatus]|nr:Uncharacterized protein GBIM_07062 [Gryllus bimaculatus]
MVVEVEEGKVEGRKALVGIVASPMSAVAPPLHTYRSRRGRRLRCREELATRQGEAQPAQASSSARAPAPARPRARPRPPLLRGPSGRTIRLEEFRAEVQRRDQEILAMSAKMKTLEEQHTDYQRHIAVLKESLCAKEEHYNMLQADVVRTLNIALEGKQNGIRSGETTCDGLALMDVMSCRAADGEGGRGGGGERGRSGESAREERAWGLIVLLH